jgi:hypothetical protein
MMFCLHETHLAETLLTATGSGVGNNAENMDSELCQAIPSLLVLQEFVCLYPPIPSRG